MENERWVSTNPTVWKPEVSGDMVEGEMIELRAEGGKYGNESYLIDSANGPVVIFSTTVLKNRMKPVNIGDFVRIIFRGTEKNKRDEDTKIFEVFRRILTEDEVVELKD